MNNSGAPYDVCANSNVASKGGIGSSVAAKFANNAFNSTIARLNAEVSLEVLLLQKNPFHPLLFVDSSDWREAYLSQASGITFTPTDALAMLELCSYETDALGFSDFCALFTEQDFINYEYYFTISF